MNWYEVKHGLKNVIKWLTVVWTDRDDDFPHFYAMILHKLKNIHELFSNPKNVYCEESRRLYRVKYLAIAIKLLERMMRNDYYTEHDHAVLATIKHEWVPCKDNPKMHEMVTISMPPAEVLDEIWNRASNLRAKSRRLFFLILEKRIETWWD